MKENVKQQNLLLTTRPIPHSDSLPVPTPPQTYELKEENENSVEYDLNKPSTSLDPHFKERKVDQPHKLSQSELRF